jgi:hypothetical protein
MKATTAYCTLILGILLAISSCKKADPAPSTTPPAPITVTNSFTQNAGTCNGCNAYYTGSTLSLFGAIASSVTQVISIYAPVTGVGTYTLASNNTSAYATYAYTSPSFHYPSTSTGTDATHTGTLNITYYNAANKIVIGTYSFSTPPDYYGDTYFSGSFTLQWQ